MIAIPEALISFAGAFAGGFAAGLVASHRKLIQIDKHVDLAIEHAMRRHEESCPWRPHRKPDEPEVTPPWPTPLEE